MPEYDKQKYQIPRRTTSFIKNEYRLYEQVHRYGKNYFAEYDRKGNTFLGYQEEIYSDGVLYTPIEDNGIEKGQILLPSGVEEYGTEKELLEEIKQFIHKYVDVSQRMEELSANYVLLSWVYDRFHTIPYLRVRGDAGSGKSRFLKIVGSLLYKHCRVNGAASAASLFRTLDRWRGSITLDEGDFQQSDMTAVITKVLLVGFEKDGAIARCNTEQDNQVEYFTVFGPKILASRREFTDKAMETRCITEIMTPTLRDDIEPRLTEKYEKEQEKLRNKLLMFRFRNYDKINPNLRFRIRGVDPRIEQAFGSFVPLFANNEVMLKRFEKYLSDYRYEMAEERADSLEGAVVNAIYRLKERGVNAITPNIISNELFVNNTIGWNISSQKVGRLLRTLGFKTERKRVGLEVKRAIVFEEKLLSQLFKRYLPRYEIILESEEPVRTVMLEQDGKPIKDKDTFNREKQNEILFYLETNYGDVLAHTTQEIAEDCGISEEKARELLEDLEKKARVIRPPLTEKESREQIERLKNMWALPNCHVLHETEVRKEG